MKKQLLWIPAAIILIGSTLGLYLLNQSKELATGYVPTPSNPVALAIHPDRPLPYLITADGQLLEADANQRWQAIGPDAKVDDVLYESTGHLWATTDAGLFLKQGDTWQLIDSTPGHALESTHGYLFSIGSDAIVRLTESKDLRLDSLRTLNLPGTPATDLVMLGSHTHILHTGEQVFHTMDVGLSWNPINAPEPIRSIWTDADGNLIAATDKAILRWSVNQWSTFLPLPEGQPITMMRVFDNRIYALAGGALYEQGGRSWRKTELPDSQNAIFTALEFEYPDTLWLLDSPGKKLYSTTDGQNWSITTIQFEPSTA